jgi:hypothetical protein
MLERSSYITSGAEFRGHVRNKYNLVVGKSTGKKLLEA